MGRLAAHSLGHASLVVRRRLVRLRNERQKLNSRLRQLDAELHKLEAERATSAAPTRSQLDNWLNEIAEGLPALPPLPADFSRADLYVDHD